jgi:hypothetical protein
MGRSACTLGEEMDCWRQGTAGRHRSNDCNCFFTVSGLFVAVFSSVDGGVPKRSKNDHFITSISMDDNGLIIDNSFQMKREHLIPTQKSEANLMVVSIFGKNGNLTNLFFSVKVKNDHFLMVFTSERY